MVLEWGSCKNHWRPSCQPPSISQILQMRNQDKEGEDLAQGHKAIWGHKSMVQLVLVISLRRSILLSLGPVLPSAPQEEGLWLLGLYRLDPLNFDLF